MFEGSFLANIITEETKKGNLHDIYIQPILYRQFTGDRDKKRQKTIKKKQFLLLSENYKPYYRLVKDVRESHEK